MRSAIAIFVFLLLAAGTASAQQQTYGNEWIANYGDFYFKIDVTDDGVKRIPYSTLTDYIPASTLNSSSAGANFILYHEGEPVPIYVSTSGSMSQGDYIEFYGEGNDGSFDTRLYKDPSKQLHDHYSLFNDTAVYYLTVNNKTNNPRISNEPNNQNSASPDDYLIYTSRELFTGNFSRGKPYYISNTPFYSSLYEEGEGFIGQDFTTNNPITYSISTPSVYSNGPQAEFKTSVLSKSDGSHTVSIDLNGNTIHTTPSSFTGFELNHHNFSSGIPGLLSSSNTVTYKANGPSPDRNAVSHIEIAYPREYDFGNATSFDFQLSANGANKRYLQIQNFDDQGTTPVLYNLSAQKRISGSTSSSGPHDFYLNFTTGRNDDMFMTSEAAIRIINNMEAKRFRNFINPSNQGDYIIITNKKLKSDGNGNNWIKTYKDLRDKSSGGKYDVTVVDIQELYDQFAYGIRTHPLAIRNFANYVVDNWQTEPSHIFLIGNARSYNKMRNNTSNYQQTLVPTFGHPPSDNLITASVDDITPLLATGRLPVKNGGDIEPYYNKMIQFQGEQDEVGDPYQTISNKAWMKEILHLGGGTDAQEQSLFKNWLNQFKTTVEDTMYGGHVTSFFKTSSSPIQISQSEKLHARIDSGVSLITFFGHSSANSFDYNLDNPSNYSNKGKYPVILSNGCFTGNIFRSSYGISEDFVLADQKGAIAFMATTGLSYSSGLYTFSSNFYDNFSHNLYGKTIGQAKRKTIADVVDCCSNLFNRLVLQEMTLNGDPALTLNTHKRPDYALERPQVSFEPSVVTTNQDSFKVQIINYNLGKAIYDSITMNVTRRFPGGDEVTFRKRFRATYYRDTIHFTIPIGEGEVFGLNNFRIKVDADEEVANELSETNNVLGFNDIELFIRSDDVFPIHPYEFSIVPDQDVTLKASTANAFADEKSYIFEIDTTELFNSPLKRSKTITQGGGVLKWTPSLTYMDSTVYYWRVSVDSNNATMDTTNWHNTSFIYIEDEYPGWNQSHYYQFLKDDFTNLRLDNSRNFQFQDDVNDVKARAGTWNQYGGSLPFGQMACYQNGGELHYWNCGGNGGFSRGLIIAVFDSTTGFPWESELNDVQGGTNQVYGNIHCKPRDFKAFPFPTYNASWYQKIIDFIDMVPDGNYILIYSINDPKYQNFNQPLINKLQSLGSNEVTNLANMGNGAPWAFFAQKGTPSSAEEKIGTSSNNHIVFTSTFQAQWYAGDLVSTKIGPAHDWGSFHWRWQSSESPSYDKQSVDIVGIDQQGQPSVLAEGVQAQDTSLSFIDADQYPNLRLRLSTRDDSARTPTQMDYWRVLYDEVPEAALNPDIHFSFVDDTLQSGQTMTFECAVENVTEIPMDSLLYKYSVTPPSNKADITYKRRDSLLGKEYMIAEFDYPTDCIRCPNGVNNFIVEANPDDDQPEKHHFNNIGILQFNKTGDNVNPLLDVTFDGRHIMDGDIVSAKPDIRIKLKDENNYLALNDTSLVNVFMKYPDGNYKRINYSDKNVQFLPADEENLEQDNSARILINKKLDQDGEYELHVQGEDRSRNASGTYNSADGIDYRVSFEVINDARISNVVNYPNPFTSQTKFVFTLTGSQVPTYFKIQIMTITGKVVREITKADLGPIHIGRNVTDYAWDGTDRFGDKLGNGLYLYRVVAKLNGKSIDHYKTGADKYFESGFGKMYLAR